MPEPTGWRGSRGLLFPAVAGPSLAERVHGSPVLRRRQLLGRIMTAPLADIDVTGLRHLPATGPVVLVANHRAFLDGPMLFGLIERPVSFLVKAEAFHPRPVARLLASAGQVPVRRHTVDPAPVRLLLEVLRAGGVVGVFPEGGRGDGRVLLGRPGAAWLALRSGAVVVPVACHGTLDMARRGRPGHRRHRAAVRVTVGEPLTVTPWTDRRSLPRRVFRAEGERVRAALADLVAATDPGVGGPAGAACAPPSGPGAGRAAPTDQPHQPDQQETEDPT